MSKYRKVWKNNERVILVVGFLAFFVLGVMLFLLRDRGVEDSSAQTLQTITVCQSGCDFNTNDYQISGHAITEAILNASQFTEIRISDGTYSGTYLNPRSKNITLIGQSKGNTIIEDDGASKFINPQTGAVLKLEKLTVKTSQSEFIFGDSQTSVSIDGPIEFLGLPGGGSPTPTSGGNPSATPTTPGTGTCDNGVPVNGTACQFEGDNKQYRCISPNPNQVWQSENCSSGKTCQGNSCQDDGSANSCPYDDVQVQFRIDEPGWPRVGSNDELLWVNGQGVTDWLAANPRSHPMDMDINCTGRRNGETVQIGNAFLFFKNNTTQEILVNKSNDSDGREKNIEIVIPQDGSTIEYEGKCAPASHKNLSDCRETQRFRTPQVLPSWTPSPTNTPTPIPTPNNFISLNVVDTEGNPANLSEVCIGAIKDTGYIFNISCRTNVSELPLQGMPGPFNPNSGYTKYGFTKIVGDWQSIPPYRLKEAASNEPGDLERVSAWVHRYTWDDDWSTGNRDVDLVLEEVISPTEAPDPTATPTPVLPEYPESDQFVCTKSWDDNDYYPGEVTIFDIRIDPSALEGRDYEGDVRFVDQLPSGVEYIRQVLPAVGVDPYSSCAHNQGTIRCIIKPNSDTTHFQFEVRIKEGIGNPGDIITNNARLVFTHDAGRTYESRCSSSYRLTSLEEGQTEERVACGPVDTDLDGELDLSDFSNFADKYGELCEEDPYVQESFIEDDTSGCGLVDVNSDGVINLFDLAVFAERYGEGSCGL